jgi:superfamily II DNA or RNA helicase
VPAVLNLTYDRGTLLLDAAEDALPAAVGGLGCWRFDKRVKKWRAPACRYRDSLRVLVRAGIAHQDQARGYAVLTLASRRDRQPFPHQAEAVDAWFQGGRGGVVVLPTGSGKTFVAELILERLGRGALIVTPTLDLMQQWYSGLIEAFGIPIGLIGGGSYEVQPITVTTYDSAYIHAERLGDRFALLVFDECHHLPGPAYTAAADLSIAPFRLGLTATPEREDGAERILDRLIGPVVFRREIKELSGDYLADYETHQVTVSLSDAERAEYEAERSRYRDFVSRQGIRMGSPSGWAMFLMASSRSEEGRRAFQAFRRQKMIAQAPAGKLRRLAELLEKHARDRVLIFTSDNATVYKIARRFLMPAITHQTKVKERHEILARFHDGTYPFLVTSRVLNEGVDVPAANVGIVLSGTGTVREHVQRLGRILRRGKDKRAVLYEVVARDTAEEMTSARRRRHDAYR